ncbi:olfactory receptor 1030 isoform X1 [Leopardus geoffroyi]|uniref:olfactory receptor 1030 isoform X1 n=1 Tax=Leopardus geoffroyi TaxID=46844 RepID=UPI001E25E79B|nr:olfactory receptor 1030 isoform X1 [Leopardus geoffroyi]
MSIANASAITEFILLGLTDRPELQLLLFVLFLVLYLVTLSGNLGMMLLIRLDSRLHTPMYFFLTNLAFVDLCYTSNATPQMLTNFLSEKKTITFVGCFTQCYIFIALLLTEFYMLAAMAYDRYVAICNPLRYSMKMSRRICLCLATLPYAYGFSDGLFQAILTFRLNFCRSNVINHFYCADPPLIKLSCSDTYVKEHKMVRGNSTLVTEFVLLGLTDRPELQPILFVLFLVIYLITVGGNLGMLVLIRIDSRLHTPMYFFLASLSCLDLCYSTNVTPKMLANFLSEKKTISYAACLTQCYFFIAMVITEYYMLAVMAYDRYVAICNPLLYSSKMSRGVCIRLIAGPYVYGFLSGLMETMWTYRLTFCDSNIINHFYCADPPLIQLSCSDTFIKETSMFVVAGFNLSNSLLIIVISYIFILTAILRMHCAEGRHKAFSTCGSHLVTVTVFYGTLFCMYVRPPTDKSVEQSKIIAVFYTFVSPMLNPIIYSLRNKNVKQAFWKLMRRNVLLK